MKVLLIKPPPGRVKFCLAGVYPMIPLGLANMAATLLEAKIDVEILDMHEQNMRIDMLPDYLKNKTFDLAGISCNLFTLRFADRIAAAIKEHNKNTPVVLGGISCKSLPPETIFERNPSIDFLVIGEGEYAIVELCKHLNDKKQPADVSGLCFRQDGNVVKNMPRGFIDLDKIPFPAYHLFRSKKYRFHPPFNIYPPVTLLETSRGCNFNCNFCSLTNPVRYRSPELVVDDMEKLTRDFGYNEIYIVDPTFPSDKNRVEEICKKILEKKLKFKWTCKSRVDTVSPELLKLMSKAGCYMILYGMETGSQDTLDKLQKHTSIKQIHDCFRWTKDAGIRILAYVMIGGPGETRKTFEATMGILKKTRPHFVLFGDLLIDPQSALAHDLMNKKLVTLDTIYNFFAEGDEKVFESYYFLDIKRKVILRWEKEAYLRFYFNPRYWISMIINIKNFRELWNIFNGGFLVIRMLLEKFYMRWPE